jgi:DHA3 family macrolide efflux protein-like MFS transporter
LAGLLSGRDPDIGWIFAVDVTTMSVAIVILLFTPISSPKRSQDGLEGSGSLWKECWYGFRYIFSHKGLLGLQLIFLFGNLFSSISWTLVAPMILAKTAKNATTLAVVESAAGIGGVVGGLVLSITGGLFRRKTDGVFIGWALPALFLGALVGFGRDLLLWATGYFLASAVGSVTYICNQAIWQSKVPPDIQGRVSSTRRLIANAVSPLATLVAGPLAESCL